jgi:galactoside 2-L-fucosyltransferase 1/2
MRAKRLLAVYAFLAISIVLTNNLFYQVNVNLEGDAVEPLKTEESSNAVLAATQHGDAKELFVELSQPFPPYNGESTVIVLKKGYGRLGNQLWQYASTLGIAQKAANSHICLSRQNAFKEIRQQLAGPFPPKCPVKLVQRVKRQQEVAFGRFNDFSLECAADDAPCVWTFDNYLQSYRYFTGIESLLRTSFQPNLALQERVDGVWNQLSVPATAIIIGLHVRKGDVMSAETMHMNNVPLSYYSNAMKYVKDRFPTPHFLLASDDKSWCRNQTTFDDSSVTFLPSDLDPVVEWSVLATKCQHMIMGVGTYGWWASFLAGGDVVYYKHPLKPEHPRNRGKFDMQDMFPPLWIGME